MSDRMPWAKFHWAAYENDVDLDMCSLAAQGLWMRLLCFMARAETYGYLVHRGKAPGLERISCIVRKPPAEVGPLMRELEKAGVFDRDENGIIFSRRLVADRRAFLIAQENGRRGGNPDLVGGGQKAARPGRRRGSRNAAKPAAIPHTNNGETDTAFPEKQEEKQVVKKGVKATVNGEVKARTEKKKKHIKEDTDVSSRQSRRRKADVIDLTKHVQREVSAAFEAWNDAAVRFGLPRATKLTDTRRRQMRARLKELGGISGWRGALEQIGQSAFLRGGGVRGWRVSLDEFLKPTIMTRIQEGRYQTLAEAAADTSAHARAGMPEWEQAARALYAADTAECQKIFSAEGCWTKMRRIWAERATQRARPSAQPDLTAYLAAFAPQDTAAGRSG
ncbi:MAG: hypothetical protein ABF876_05460 [Acetobacter aceti]